MLGRNASSTWLYVETARGVKGWASAAHLNLEVAIGTLPVVGVTPPPASSPATGIINTHALNVRSGPGPGYAVQIALPRNTQLTLLGRNAAGTWLQVRRPGGAIGWVDASYVRTSANISALPVVSVDQPPATKALGTVATGALNVRTGPGVSFSAFQAISWGTQVELLGRAPGSSWTQVKLASGQTGWVNSVYLRMNVSLQSLPVVK